MAKKKSLSKKSAVGVINECETPTTLPVVEATSVEGAVAGGCTRGASRCVEGALVQQSKKSTKLSSSKGSGAQGKGGMLQRHRSKVKSSSSDPPVMTINKMDAVHDNSQGSSSDDDGSDSDDDNNRSVPALVQTAAGDAQLGISATSRAWAKRRAYELDIDSRAAEIAAANKDSGKAAGHAATTAAISQFAAAGKENKFQSSGLDTESVPAVPVVLTNSGRKRDQPSIEIEHIRPPAGTAIEEMLQNVENSSETGIGHLKAQLEQLQKAQSFAGRSEIPESRVKRARHERIAQLKAAQSNIQKYIPQVAAMQKSEQLQLNEVPLDMHTTAAQLTASFSASNDFERELNEAIINSGIGASHLKSAGVLTADEKIQTAQRQRNMAKLRSLMFQEQRRNKQQAKIKSKMWHKIQRRSENLEKERLLEWLDEDNPSLAAQIRSEFEEKRATLRVMKQQRARQKWAKVALRFGGKDMQKVVTTQNQIAYDDKAAVERIAKKSYDDSDGDDDYNVPDDDINLSSDEEDTGDNSNKSYAGKVAARAKRLVVEQLEKAEADKEEDGEQVKGVLGMRFMRDAREKRRKEGIAKSKELLEEIEEIEDGDESLEGRMIASKNSAAVLESLMGGSRGGPTAAAKEEAPVDKEAVAAAEADIHKLFGIRNTTHTDELIQVKRRGDTEGTHNSRRSTDGATGGVASNDTSEIHNARKNNLSKADGENARRDVADTTSKGNASFEKKSDMRRVSSERSGKGLFDSATSGVNSIQGLSAEVEELLSSGVTLKESRISEESKLMVREAFVTGKQTEDFAEKIAEEEACAEEEMSEAQRKRLAKLGKMPGWGGWVGAKGPIGRVHSKNVGFKPTRKPKVKENEAVSENGSKKKGVIVSRKLDRKLAKYFVKEAPGPFENAEQYEFSLKHPVGPEWNTAEVHQRLVQPKVLIRTGTVVTPLEYATKMPTEEVDSLLESWDQRKKRVRTKARL